MRIYVLIERYSIEDTTRRIVGYTHDETLASAWMAMDNVLETSWRRGYTVADDYSAVIYGEIDQAQGVSS